jgi:S1-C subfamily serine protease
VQAVVSNSPAAKAGLLENDVITAVDGEPAGNYALWEIQDLLEASGHVVKLAIKRGARSFICEVALQSLA